MEVLKNWKFGINLTIQKKIGNLEKNLEKIWKFGKNMEIWENSGKSRRIIES